MKHIKGGYASCRASSCTLFVQGQGTYTGYCTGFAGGTVVTCWCQTPYGSYQPSGQSACFS